MLNTGISSKWSCKILLWSCDTSYPSTEICDLAKDPTHTRQSRYLSAYAQFRKPSSIFSKAGGRRSNAAGQPGKMMVNGLEMGLILFRSEIKCHGIKSVVRCSTFPYCCCFYSRTSKFALRGYIANLDTFIICKSKSTIKAWVSRRGLPARISSGFFI